MEELILMSSRNALDGLMNAIFPNYFDANGNYIGGPFTKKEIKELQKDLTDEFGEEDANEIITDLKNTIKVTDNNKEDSKMSTTTVTKTTTGNELVFINGNTTYTGCVIYCMITENPDGKVFYDEVTNNGFIGKDGITTLNGRRYRTAKCLKVEKSFFNKKQNKDVHITLNRVELTDLSQYRIKSAFDAEVNKDMEQRNHKA